MASSADVLVRFLADTSQVDKGVSSMGSTLKGFGRSLTTFLGGAAVGAFAKDAITAASDLNENMSKVNVVFGKSAGAIRKFADTSAEVLGISTNQALDAAGAYGNMFTQLGFTTDAAAGMSKRMLTLTADLVSFHNADPTEVLEAQQAAFRGEYDAIQRFIPTINAASVEQRALADTGKASADQLTAGEKAAAAYALMIEGAGKAEGDRKRTLHSAANEQKTMNAEMDNAQAKIGQALLPALQTVTPWIATLADAFANAEPDIQKAAVALAGFGVVALLVGGPVGAIIAAIGAIGVALFVMWTKWDEIWSFMANNPWLLVLASIVAAPIVSMFLLIGALRWVAQNWDEIWSTIKGAAEAAGRWIVDRWNEVVAFFKGIPGAIENALSTVWNVITSPFRSAVDEVKNIIGEIGGAFDSAIGAVKSVWNAFARGWNSIHIEIPSVDLPIVGEVGGGSLDLPNLPILARGGIVNSPTLAILGEAGREAVVPLPARGGIGGTNVYAITVNVPTTTSPSDVGAAVVDAIRSYERANGAAWRAS